MQNDSKKRPRRRDFLKAAGVAGVAGLAGCLGGGGGSTGGGGDGPIHFGGILPLTGGLANPATWIERAWNLWKDQTNGGDGLLGRDVELTVYDAELNKNKMRSLTQRLLQQDAVDVFIGPYPTLTMPVISPILQQNDMTVVHQFWPRSHLVARQEGSDKFPTQYGFSSGTYSYPRAFVRFLDTLDSPPERIAMAGMNNLYGKDSYASWKQFLGEASFDSRIVGNEYYDPGATSLSSVARKLKTTNPDLVVVNCYMGDGILFMQGAADVSLDPTFGYWASVGPQIPEWIPSLGSTGNYVFGSTPYAYSVPTEANEELFQIAQDEFGAKPHYSYGFGYMQCQIYEQAIREAGEVSQSALDEGFSSMNFDVITGQLEFAETNFADAPMFVTQVQDPEIQTVWPEDAKSADPIYPLPDGWPKG